MKIRNKLFAGLLAGPVVFAIVAMFLIRTNGQVQHNARMVATYETQLGGLAAQLSVAFITGQKAAEELMAEKRRARLEPEEEDEAEAEARDAEAVIIESGATIDKILDSLAEATQHSVEDARQKGNQAGVSDETEEFEAIQLIRTESDRYQQFLKKYLEAINTKPDEADVVLNEEVEPEYEQRLQPLVESYVAARQDEVSKKSLGIEQSVSQVSQLVTRSAVGTLLVSILIGLYLSHSFSQPLKKLAAAADEIGKGRLSSKIEIKSSDEIGLLARAFNQMADDLSRTTVSKGYVDGIIKSMGDSLVVTSSDDLILTVNAATCRMLGYTEAELIGQPLTMLFAPDEVPPLDDKLDEGGLVSNVETTYLAKDGRNIPVAFSRALMQEDSTHASGLVCGAKDITERKQLEEQLRQERIFLRTVIDNIPDTVYVKDMSCRKVIANLAEAHALGAETEAEVLGKDDFELHPKELAEKFFADDQVVLQTGQPVLNREEFVIDKNGQKTWLLTTKIPLRNEGGQIIGLVGLGRDITERKRLDLDVIAARDAALESTRLKSEFLANMSHEIRTPMNGVIGMTGLLLDTELTNEQRDFAETIRSSGDSLLTIINDILDFSKMEAGKLKFETLDFDLSNAVEGTVELLAERSREKEIELASLIQCGVPTSLRGDPGRLRQVLTNLIGNAIKFTSRGEVVVRAERETETDNDVVIRFEISDTGIGISEMAQKRLFQPFIQADGSTTRKFGGTGLGLAISKQLVELMGGQIGVTSVAGEGSTFWFTAKLDKQMSQVATPQPNLESLRGLYALIVDDNATNRKILQHQLTSWKMTHNEADSGTRALESLRSAAVHGRPYDLAILDLMMPGMDGFELARAIKSDPSIAAVRLVLLTSYGQRGDGAIARKAGIAAYIAKPVRQSQLFLCLMSTMGQSTPGAEPQIAAKAAIVTKHTLAETRPGSKKLILLAEDNIVNQKVAVRQLQKLGYRADAVADGREALEALRRIPYDLVLMDCQMPEMDGYEATTEIRRREGTTRHTPIVAMTAHALEGDRAKCIAAGMDDYISKPVKPKELGEVLERLLAVTNNRVDSAPLPSAEVSTLLNQAVLHRP